MTVNEKFDEFKSKLEITKSEEEDAIRKHKHIREKLLKKIKSEEGCFMTGSYARKTKIHPMNDVDMFVVYHDELWDEFKDSPQKIIADLKECLIEIYGENFRNKVREQYHSVNINFSTIGFDAIPAFNDGENYKIPDTEIGSWIKTNPKKHGELLLIKNRENQQKLIPIIKMIKKWNLKVEKEAGKKPLKSFLIEVLLMNAFESPPSSFKEGVRIAFDYISNNIIEGGFEDPAGLGPNIDSKLTNEDRKYIAQLTKNMQEKANQALATEVDDEQKALTLWYEIFGDPFYNPDKGKPIRAGVRKRESKLPADSPNRRFGEDDA